MLGQYDAIQLCVFPGPGNSLRSRWIIEVSMAVNDFEILGPSSASASRHPRLTIPIAELVTNVRRYMETPMTMDGE